LSTRSPNPPDTQPADETITTESLGWQLRAALPPLRLHSLSLYDLEGEVRWLSEGALGPDEHGLVVEALASLGEDPSCAYREDELGDGRTAVLLASRSGRVGLAGLVMILVDSKSLAAGSLAARVLTADVRSILDRLAVLLAAGPADSGPGAKARNGAAGTPPKLALEPTTVDELLTLQVAKEALRSEDPTTSTGVWRALPAGTATGQWPAPGKSAGATGQWSAPPGANPTGQWAAPPAGANATGQWPAQPVGATGVWRAPPPGANATGQWRAPPAGANPGGQAAAPLGSTTLTSKVPVAPKEHAPVSAESTTRSGRPPPTFAPKPASGISDAAVEIFVQELVRLRPGNGTRRFHVVPGSSLEETSAVAAGAASDSGSDSAVQAVATTLSELTGWLAAHRQMLESVSVSFSMAIDAAALAAEELPDAIAEFVQPARLRGGTVGFEIAEALCLRYRPQTERLMRKLEALGCALVLDDFVFDSSALELLRSKVLRLVKVHPGLIAGVSRDRLCQARAVAIAQASRVLGIHCSAKRVGDQATCRWLAWAGFEFVEGPLFERQLSLPSLGALLAGEN
jgi:EAL domain-containing protein (putative c-di-GMP-specific phosphodiesterase class I)